MSELELVRIQSVIDMIRLQEVKPGTTIRASITLVTCPADMDQIERSLRALDEQDRRTRADERRKVIAELVAKAQRDHLYVHGYDRDGVIAPEGYLADWLRAQDGTAPHE